MFVRFRDDDGEVRGATSVAVKTLTVDIQFAGGGGVVLPEGSLPEGTIVTTSASATPLLPDDFEPIGTVMKVVSASALARPAQIRFPLPAGANPDDLTIYRFEDDGTMTILGTNVDGSELIAGTPGFSRFGIAASSGIRMSIAGPDILPFGGRVFIT